MHIYIDIDHITPKTFPNEVECGTVSSSCVCVLRLYNVEPHFLTIRSLRSVCLHTNNKQITQPIISIGQTVHRQLVVVEIKSQ